jgi:hypothetical protein
MSRNATNSIFVSIPGINNVLVVAGLKLDHITKKRKKYTSAVIFFVGKRK